MEILSHASAKKKTKRLKVFKFRLFRGSFSNDIMAVKGLSSWRLGRSEVLGSLTHSLRAQSPAHHTIDRLVDRGMENGSARRSTLKVLNTSPGVCLEVSLSVGNKRNRNIEVC